MSYEIFIRADPGYEHYNTRANDAVLATLKQVRAASGKVTVVLTSCEYVQDLNRQYRKVDKPTDVLSFASGDKDPETQKTYLGDVIIAMPKAESQAAESGHSANAELSLLVVHGMLHLLGFDHQNDAAEQKMWAIQKDILAILENEILGPEVE